MNILFICSKNQWRSRTAEEIFKNHPIHKIQSAGTSKTARIRISQKMLDWADWVFVMENKHKKRIQEKFRPDKELIVLDIPDEYRYMDAELIDMLRSGVEAYF